MVAGDPKADYLWCAVSDANVENGYKFYNLIDGTKKVLGFTIDSGDGGNDRAKMYDVDNVPEGVVTTLVYCANQLSGTNSFKLNGTDNRYLNSRDPYLAVWADGRAVNTQCAGSAFTFEEVSSDEVNTLLSSRYEELKMQATTYYEAESGHEGELFYHTQTAVDNIKSICTSKPTDVYELCASINKIKVFLSGNGVTMPTAGKRYALKNVYNGNYVYMPINFGTDLTSINALCRNACWILEQGSSDGAYRFRNAVTNYYTSTDEFDPGVSTFDYSFYLNHDAPGVVAIGNGEDANAHKFLHMNPSPARGWTADAGASQWRFEEISDDAYNALPAIDENAMDFIALKAQLYNARLPKATGSDVTAAKTAFTSSKTLENAKAYMAAVENNQYVRIISVSPFKDLQLDDNGIPVSTAVPNDLTVSTVWRLEFVDPVNNDFRMKIRHMNTGKYLGAVYGSVGMSDDFTNGGAFTITPVDVDKYYIADGYGTKLCYTSSGSLSNTGSDKWYMDFAKQVNIPLTIVGTKTYATAYLPFPVSAVTGANAYVGTINAERNYIDFTDVTSGFAAREGVVLEGESSAADHKAVLTIGGNVEKKDNCFTGSCTPVSVAESERDNYRVLGISTTDENHIAFFKPSVQLTTIGANRAFILNTNLQSVLNVRYGQIEGIGEVNTSSAIEHTDAPVYDLTGRRVMQTIKGGVYVQNGKKFIVK